MVVFIQCHWGGAVGWIQNAPLYFHYDKNFDRLDSSSMSVT